MKRMLGLLAAGAAAVHSGSLCQAIAAPTPSPPITLRQDRAVAIPFDPPLQQPLRYRIEKVDERNGTTTQTNSTVTFTFEETEDGYRLIVTPVSSVSDAPEPEGDSGQRLSMLAENPYTLILDLDGTILGMEQEQVYWDAIFAHVEAQTSRPGMSPDVTAAGQRLMATLREMPEETRLALLTEEVQPLLSLASSELQVGERITTPVALPSPVGGTIDSNVFMTLERVSGGTAHVSSHVSLSRESMERATRDFVTQILPADREDVHAQIQTFFSQLESFSREISETYEISTASGLTERYRSTDTTNLIGGGETGRRVTIRSMQWID